jgi:hypothetical protein
VPRNLDLVFYIYVPGYRDNSAGIGVLYRLCDGLNLSGFNAFIVRHNPSESSDPHNFLAPILTKDLRDLHFHLKSKIVTIYSETVVGNPLNAKNIVRYLLNFPGDLGGVMKFPKLEFVFAYSKVIADEYDGDCKILFIPAVDPFKLPPLTSKEDLSLVYAGKYRAFVGTPVYQYRQPSIEIYRDGPNRQSRKETLDLLSKASQIYVWENSSIATEAILLGTPVIFIKSEFLRQIIAEVELGSLGFTFEDSEESIELAKSQIPFAKQKYLEVWNSYLSEISKFGNFFESISRDLIYETHPIRLPLAGCFFNSHRVRMFISIVRHLGILSAIRVTKEFGYLRIRRKS